jgi:membrane protein
MASSPWKDKFFLLGTFASALAFDFLLALVPLFILAAMLVYAVLKVDITPQIGELLRQVIPANDTATSGRVAAAVLAGSSKGWFTLGFAGVLWASTSFMNELACAIHLLFAEDMDPRAGGWLRRAKALGLVLLWCTAMVGACMLFLLAHELPHLLARWPAIESPASLLAHTGRWFITFTLLFAAMTVTFRYVPSHPANLKACAGGGALVALAWMLMGSVLTRLLPVIWSQSPLPIAFGSFLVFMFWAYLCCWALLLGAFLVARFGTKA